MKMCLLCPVQKGRVGGLHGAQGFTKTDRDGEGQKEATWTGRNLGRLKTQQRCEHGFRNGREKMKVENRKTVGSGDEVLEGW